MRTKEGDMSGIGCWLLLLGIKEERDGAVAGRAVDEVLGGLTPSRQMLESIGVGERFGIEDLWREAGAGVGILSEGSSTPTSIHLSS